jgi:hypothetical protein
MTKQEKSEVAPADSDRAKTEIEFAAMAKDGRLIDAIFSSNFAVREGR